ncbi:COR domain-containing protein [Streptomyces sp. A012304]|uniref:COR domain-containing protein n=1 Tax=Streptomyces sp. A012304 TaxID=375446 RepID=UPI002231D592|nr:COR domain-containing protein [Streptomyces sp. A012304]
MLSAAGDGKPNVDLTGAGLTELPPQLRELRHLRRLNLTANLLSELPDWIGELTELEALDLDENSVIRLPDSLSGLSRLEILFLAGNGLTEVPAAVRALPRLHELNLRENRLTTLPDWIEELTELVTLNLDRNAILRLPESFGRLDGLGRLDMDHNGLTEVPPPLRGLTSLRALYLAGNKLRELPEWLWSLRELGTLELSDNPLGKLPEHIGHAVHVRQLGLGRCGLTELPGSIGALSQLTALLLNHNRLRDLPDSVGKFSDGVGLVVGGNPLTALPPEVVSAGTPTLLAFLRERARASVPQWSSKIVVVGEGRAGKTSLLKAVRKETFDPQESSTHGLNVDSLRLPHPDPAHDGVTMNLATWDFGGQEIYHATHQFFLTDRSLFVLVWDAQVGWEASKLYYWLDMIKARAPRAPVVLVATHLGPRPAELPLAELQKAYPGLIVDSLAADSATREGIDAVVESLARHAARLPLMGVLWPQTWLRAAEAVRADPRNHVTPEELNRLLATSGVADLDHQRSLRAALHSLGDILAYTDDPELEDIAVLRPQWVTDYISKVLDSRRVRESRALFARGHQAELWSDLDPGLRRHFVVMMEHFDLSYRTDDGTSSLVVELLPLDPPDYGPQWEAAEQPQHREIRLRYRLHTVPPGIPTWFIAREHRFTAGLHWRSGALLRQSTEDGDHTALVTVDRLTKTAELQVRGPYPQSFFAVLKDGFEQTLQRYPGLEITRLVPCPGRLPDGSDCTHEFLIEQLKDRLARRPALEKIECPVDYDHHDVRLLLQGIESPTAHISARMAQETKEAVQTLQSMVEQQGRDQAAGRTDLLEQLQLAKAQRLAVAAEQQRAALAAWHGRLSHRGMRSPTLLSVTQVDRRRALGLLPGSVLRLRLYCEAPGAWHPVPGHEPYEVRATTQKKMELLPYVRRVLQVLRYAVPVAEAELGVAADDVNKQLKDDIAAMEALVDETRGFDDWDPHDDSWGLTETEWGTQFDATLALLAKLDPDRRWGGLSKVVTPEGDTFWLCGQHARPYLPPRPQPPHADDTPALPPA